MTGRRPDNPGFLIGGKPASPSSLRFKVEDPAGGGWQQMELALYDADGPLWIEGGRDQGVDLALIRLKDTPRFPLPVSQSFATNSSKNLEPGMDVVLIGHPFVLGRHSASATWKGAMVASDAGSAPWILLDAPGVPGMSGSPVYRRVATSSQDGCGFCLELLGVYAGAVGEKALDELRLGRMFPINLVEDVLRLGQRGHNPFPPSHNEPLPDQQDAAG